MTNEDIIKFMQKKKPGNAEVRISFKARNSLKGIFIQLQDYEELQRKNLWRIVSESHINAYRQTNDGELARIFNGAEFTKLEVLS